MLPPKIHKEDLQTCEKGGLVVVTDIILFIYDQQELNRSMTSTINELIESNASQKSTEMLMCIRQRHHAVKIDVFHKSTAGQLVKGWKNSKTRQNVNEFVLSD